MSPIQGGIRKEIFTARGEGEEGILSRRVGEKQMSWNECIAMSSSFVY